ncbi:MAG: helix-turn-helix domain-containing protein [Candidatus Methanofastidiosa archaeon]|nr:helix-turn-helix domain-containing protein [Candidatus Methanofastidiosa archaeon]
MTYIDVLYSIAISHERFIETLKATIYDEQHMSISSFAEYSKIPKSTLYKIFDGNREPTLKAIRDILRALKRLEDVTEQPFIAVIAARSVLSMYPHKTIKMGDNEYLVREFSAVTMDDAIISAVNAERGGALAIVCAPIVSPTIDKIVKIPVITMMPKFALEDAIIRAAKKISG